MGAIHTRRRVHPLQGARRLRDLELQIPILLRVRLWLAIPRQRHYKFLPRHLILHPPDRSKEARENLTCFTTGNIAMSAPLAVSAF